MADEILFSKELNEKIVKGVNTLADAVCSTLGPRGRNVILQEKNHKPIITKDGVSIARKIKLKDPFENAAAQIIKQSAEATVNIAGDGTSSSTAIARAIIVNAYQEMRQFPFLSPTDIKKDLDIALEALSTELSKIAVPIKSSKDIEQIATISANGDKGIGLLISKAVDTVGRNGSITIQKSPTTETSLDNVEGFQIDEGILARDLVTDRQRSVCRFEDCVVMVTDHEIRTIDELMPILSAVARDGRPFVIVAQNVEGQALAAIILNHLQGDMKVTAIKAPFYGEERQNVLEDLALSLNATFISQASGKKVKNVEFKDLGFCKTFEANRNSSIFVAGAFSEEQEKQIEARVEGLREQVRDPNVSLKEAERINDRIQRLISSVAVINVGGSTEVEMKEKMDRIEDALQAVNSAQQEGIVPGGGVALLRALATTQEKIKAKMVQPAHSFRILKAAIEAPLREMLKNAGISNVDGIIQTILEEHPEREVFDGYDVYNEKMVNMREVGIIDPCKVTRSALKNAISAAGTLLTTNVAIIEAVD